MPFKPMKLDEATHAALMAHKAATSVPAAVTVRCAVALYLWLAESPRFQADAAAAGMNVDKRARELLKGWVA